MDTIDLDFMHYAEALPVVSCGWCYKECELGDVNCLRVIDGSSVLWQCPLCNKWNGVIDEDIVEELNARAEAIVKGGSYE